MYICVCVCVCAFVYVCFLCLCVCPCVSVCVYTREVSVLVVRPLARVFYKLRFLKGQSFSLSESASRKKLIFRPLQKFALFIHSNLFLYLFFYLHILFVFVFLVFFLCMCVCVCEFHVFFTNFFSYLLLLQSVFFFLWRLNLNPDKWVHIFTE